MPCRPPRVGDRLPPNLQTLQKSAVGQYLLPQTAADSAAGLWSLPPPGPSAPDSRRATVVTVVSVMSTGTISGSLPLNISRLCTNDGWASGCFDRRTSKTGSHVLGNVSSVWSTPPFSLSEIHRTSNIKGFPALFHRGAVTTVSQHIVHLVSSYALGCPYYTPMDPYLIQ